jgi:hypothetical protein
MVSLAPLQRIMLADSLAAAGSIGQHVEQVEIIFAKNLTTKIIVDAWAETVAQTEALRMSFHISAEQPFSWKPATAREMIIHTESLTSWDTLLAKDREQKLLSPQQPPWRAAYWPETRQFLWTFHHALLDGRSITRILHAFLKRVAGENSDFLTLAKWHDPSDIELTAAANILRNISMEAEPFIARSNSKPPALKHAICHLGHDFLRSLKSNAAKVNVTAATVLTWAWGQALLKLTNTDTELIEQVRCGAPQAQTAGFTMNTLPVIIRRKESLHELQNQLLALRTIENVTPIDFPDSSSLLMIEHGTLHYMLRDVAGENIVESIILHECKGESLIATAHISPDLRLEVEGPEKFDLLDQWIAALQKFNNS